ncbi:MAG: transketolase [Oligoflexia bacterium]|nr:transketolase [Oligoflexia bacterium]
MKKFVHIKDKVKQIFVETVKIHWKAKETRVASSVSPIEIFCVLFYGKLLDHNPSEPYWENRDRFIISKGHGSICFYPIFADLGYFAKDELERVGDKDSFLGGIPDPVISGYETVNGSLGHGIGVACGIAKALKTKGKGQKVFVLTGDGELCEGSIWEGLMFASHHQLDNIIAIVDNNKISMLDFTKNIIGEDSWVDKFKAFGWDVYRVDGHDVENIYDVISRCKNSGSGKPQVIIADTIKGRMIPGLENHPLSHVMSINESTFNKIIEENKYE